MPNSPILRDHTSSSIAKAIDENMAFVRHALWGNYRKLPNVEVVTDDTIGKVYTGLPGPMFNGVFYAHLDPQELESRIDAVIDYFRQRKAAFSWWVGPTSTPKTLGVTLLARGMTQAPFKTPGMAIDLRTLNEQLLDTAQQASNVEIQRVQTKTDLKTWVEITGKVYGFTPETVEAFYQMHLPHLARQDTAPIVNYLAVIDDTPIGVSYLAYAAGVAGLYSVGTLSEYRGHKVGTAISLAPLLEAKQHGYEIGILQSAQKAITLYQRIGFTTHCHFKTYFKLPE